MIRKEFSNFDIKDQLGCMYSWVGNPRKMEKCYSLVNVCGTARGKRESLLFGIDGALSDKTSNILVAHWRSPLHWGETLMSQRVFCDR